QYDSIGVIYRKAGKWVIGGIVEANGAGIIAKLQADFPGMATQFVNPATQTQSATPPPSSASFNFSAASSAGSPPADLSSLVADFHADLKSAQLVFDEKLILRFCASLLARRFLLLTGLSGSGKTKLAEAFAMWLTPKASSTDRARYKIVPVGADWTSSEPVLGYPDALNATRYETKPTLELLLSAVRPEQSDRPHFLILDEMNLSHVERYFAEFLSAMETGRAIDLYAGAPRSDVPREVSLAPNLYVTGTVNVDETTYLFSPKVLDRANVVEFRAEEDTVFGFLESFAPVDLTQLEGRGERYASVFTVATRSPPQLSAEDRESLAEAFRRIFRIMSVCRREFGFRTLYDVGRFTYYYRELVGPANWDIDEAIDAQIYQRLLTRLNGSRAQLQSLIWALGTVCLMSELNDADFEFRVLKPLHEDSTLPNPFETPEGRQVVSGEFVGAKYPLSCEKLYRMDRRLLREGFVSYMEA